MSIHAYICLYFSYPSICGSKLFSSTQLEIGGISAHMNMLHTSGHRGWPYLSQLCTPAKAALWSKTRVTGDPTSAIFPVCSFSLQSSPGLIPLFSAGTYYENLWRKFYSFVSSQRKASHMFWDSSALQTKAQCVGRAGKVALKSALLIWTKTLM